MNDLVVRLLLKTSGFDADLGKAKKSAGDFASQIGGRLAGAVGKFAAGIGVAMGGMEGLNRVMRSSQTLSDTFDNTMNSLKGSVDAFFQSLSTGNWDAFNGGLMQTISNMYKVSSMQDMLADAKLTMGFDTKQFEREYVRLEGIIDDESKSKSEREKAMTEMNALVDRFKDRVQKTAAGAAETLVAEMNAKFGQNFTLADLEKYITEVNNEFLDTETLQRLNEYKSQLAEMNKNLYVSSGGGTFGSIGGANSVVEKQIAAFKAQNAELEKMRILQEDNDESRRNMLAQLEYANDLYRQGDDFFKRSLEKQNKIASLNKGSSESGGITSAVAGSLAAIDAEIKKTQQEYANTASAAAREAAMKTIQELQNKKGLIELHARVTMPGVGNGKSGSLAALAGGLPTTLGQSPLSIGKEEIKNTEDYANAINSVANALTAVSTATGEGAAAFLSWASSVMTATAQAVQAIRTVVAAKTAEAAASAGASAASTPVVGWLMIGGAIAAALAAFSKIPKFAEGGVVGGSSYFGDKLLARVNSGEMILNQGQQARLLSMTEGGNVRVTGDVRLNGKDIYISLRNYMASSGNRL